MASLALIAGTSIPQTFGDLRPAAVTNVPVQENAGGHGPVARADGPLSTAAVLVTLGGATPRFTVDEARDAIFGDHAEGSASHALMDLSRGRVWLHGDVFDPVDVALGPVPCDFRAWSAAARRQIGGLEGYDRVVYLFSGNVGCDPHGAADPSSREIWILNFLDVATVVHEILHGINVGHAGSVGCAYRDRAAIEVRWWSGCTVTEYGDGYDAMGHGPAELSGTNLAALGWLEPYEVETVEETGSFELGCHGRRGGAPTVLRIPRAGGTWFDVEWNCDSGGGLLVRMAGLDDNATAVIGMHAPVGDRDALGLHETFTDAVEGISITLAREGLPDGDVRRQSMAFPGSRAFVLVDLEGRGRAGGPPPAPTDIAAEVVDRLGLRLTWAPSQTDREVAVVYDLLLSWPDGSAGGPESATYLRLGQLPESLAVEITAIDAFGRRSATARSSFALQDGAMVRTDR